MNTLSWLIYASEVFDNLRTCIGIAIASIMFLIPVLCLKAGHNTDFGDGKPGDWKKPLVLLWIPAVLAILLSLTPSARTIYMIAASEAGEAVVTSPDAIEMMGDLKAIIRKRLKDELGEVSK